MKDISQETLDQFRRVSIFSKLSEKDAQNLLEKMEEKVFQPDEIVVEKGAEGDKCFIIVDGEFQIFLRQGDLGFEKELWRGGPGKYFGEIALLTGRKRSATVRALKKSRVLILTKEILNDAISLSPEVGLALCQGIAGYIERNVDSEIAIKFDRLSNYHFDSEISQILPTQVSSYFKAIPIKKEDDLLTIAMIDPSNQEVRKFIREILPQYIIDFVAVSEEDYSLYVEKYLSRSHQILNVEKEKEPIEYRTHHGIIKSEPDNPASQLLDTILTRAIYGGASDVHLEPWGEDYKVRFRIDGKMIFFETKLTPDLFEQTVSRIKVMAEVDITNRRTPQDGRFHVHFGNRKIEVRSSFLPCQGGEKVVLRILDPKLRRLELKSLILAEPVAAAAEELFLNPQGMILVTGATGSGKTTTLYAGLSRIWQNGERINVITVEDPIEYQMDFATQVQVNRHVGLDFAQILRTVLRQDPDVILVGEIRDQESAGTAVEAALTGHLVLSSLHTHFALDAISRLRNLKIEPFLIAGALQGVISQKLVPRICLHCKEKVKPDPKILKRLHSLGILETEDEPIYYRGKGCDLCRFDGEVGRVGLFEMIQVDEVFRGFIEEGLPKHELQQKLTPENFISMPRYARFFAQRRIRFGGIPYPTFPTERFP